MDVRVEGSAWAAHRPGLLEESDRLLERLPYLLDEAARRGENILATSLADRTSLTRLARLIGLAAPDLLPALRNRNAESIVPVLSRLALHGGPTFVKLGQLIASTRGLAPEWVADAFAGCRDAVPPAPEAAIDGVLRQSGLADHLRSWNRVPMASASVAQVHEATFTDGTEVVVKVRRPGIVGTVAADASYLMPLLRLVEARNERLRLANLHGTLELMIRLFAQEVDFRLEAANIVDMALAFERAGASVTIPAPIPGYVTKRAFAMERIDGLSAASETGALEALGHRGADLVRLALVGTLQTTMTDGIFHGDLHLGNVLVTPDGLALIDFGITGRLTSTQRAALFSLLGSLMAEDRNGIAQALADFGALPPGTDPASVLAQLPEPLTREQRQAMRANGGRAAMQDRVTQVVRALSAAGFRVPPELTLFAKNLVYLSDAIGRHAPDLDLPTELFGALSTVLSPEP